MALYSSKDVGFFLLGGYNMLGATSKFDDTVELSLTETPVLGQADEGWWSSGAKKTTIEQEGYFDDSTGSIHEALVGLSNVALPLTFATHGNINGARCDIYQSVQRVGYDVQVAVPEVTKAKGRYGCWYGKKYSTIVHALGTETTAGNTDGPGGAFVDLGVAGGGTNGGAVVFHVTAVGGGTPPTNVTLKLRHSTTSGSGYADKATTAAITAASIPATSAEYVTFTGTLNRYLSVAWSYSGGVTPSVTFAAAVYVAPAP
jgi:hypothetical protein